MTKSDRDASVDRLLPDVLRGRAAEADGRDCLDAETLAAWADAALPARERADAEAHAANCARCQMLLAAMVRTEPSSSAAAPSPLRTRMLWWIAAVAPVAAALVVWLAVPNRAPVSQSQRAEAIEPAAPAEPVPPRAALAAPRPAAPREDAQIERPAREAASGPSALAKELDAAAAPPEQSARDQKAKAAPAEADALAGARASTSAPAAAPSAVPAAPASASLRREAFSASARASNFASPDAVIVSSNPSTRFRLLTGGGVQRSADGGATWRVEVTGATETLTAGVSPSPSVCWLIGPSGTIVLSTDGRSWRRVAFPEAVDLRAITAADHENATVTTADGRAFVTTDGGRTWARPPDF